MVDKKHDKKKEMPIPLGLVRPIEWDTKEFSTSQLVSLAGSQLAISPKQDKGTAAVAPFVQTLPPPVPEVDEDGNTVAVEKVTPPLEVRERTQLMVDAAKRVSQTDKGIVKSKLTKFEKELIEDIDKLRTKRWIDNTPNLDASDRYTDLPPADKQRIIENILKSKAPLVQLVRTWMRYGDEQVLNDYLAHEGDPTSAWSTKKHLLSADQMGWIGNASSYARRFYMYNKNSEWQRRIITARLKHLANTFTQVFDLDAHGNPRSPDSTEATLPRLPSGKTSAKKDTPAREGEHRPSAYQEPPEKPTGYKSFDAGTELYHAMPVVKPKMIINRKAMKKYNRHNMRPSEEGYIPRYWHRWPLDGAIFATRKRMNNKQSPYIFVLDCSGSMSFQTSQFDSLIEASPNSVVVAYGGWGAVPPIHGHDGKTYRGAFVVAAHRGLVVDKEVFFRGVGAHKTIDRRTLTATRVPCSENYVDFQVLSWTTRNKQRLAGARSRIVWISDGGVGRGQEPAIYSLRKRHDIRRIDSFDEAIKWATQLSHDGKER